MKKLSLLLSFVLLFTIVLTAQEEARLLRFPAICESQIVFCYAGDLYSVSDQGGIARKLTSFMGYEMFPRFSPDGKTIAFTGQYDGNTEVYTIPAHGGEPKRITHTTTVPRDDISDRMGPNNIVMTWTPDGKSIIYRSKMYSFNSFKGALFEVAAGGGLSRQLPLSTGGFCSYSPDAKKLAFNRVFREFRTWKYYKGGMADDVWVFDLESHQIINITQHPSQDIFPMWSGKDIFFLSDRDRVMNLFVYNTESKQTEKVTNFTDFDIKFPSMGKDYIVFEKGGFIYKLNIKTRKYEKVEIHIGDDLQYARDGWKDASKRIQQFNISPNGERAVVSARGEIFSIPSKSGVTRNLTQSSGIHEREAAWSPNGKYVAYLSDKSGEFEIFVSKEDGSELPQQLTKNADSYIFGFKWSPDSKKILFCDQMFRLSILDIASKEVTLIERAKYWPITDYNWSPDSRWVVYNRSEKNGNGVIQLYNLQSKTINPVTDAWYSSSSPSFSNDGKYLYFSSARDFYPLYSQTEWNHAYFNMERIYLVTLSKETPSPLTPENNEVKVEAFKSTPVTSEKAKNNVPVTKKDSTEIKIDLDGIQERIIGLPVKPSNYTSIVGIGDKVYYQEQANQLDNQSKIKIFDLKKKVETDLGSNISFVVSPNYKKMLVKQDEKLAVIDLPVSKIELKDFCDLSDMKVLVNYRQEWQQIFTESWRHMRDFFYVSNMHGVDWKAMYQKYSPLVPYAKCRDDLSYIIGEMVAELNIGHAYVGTGEKPQPERIKTGLLGAIISRDSSGYYRIDEILPGTSWNNQIRSPLKAIGVNVNPGNFILAVNGTSTRNINDFYQLMVNTSGKQVEITVNQAAKMEGSRKVIVVPIENESPLYYYRWVQNNIKKVSEATNGEVGYLHIPDMGITGLNEFAKYFYPQTDKKALIIDDRGNAGGSVSPMIIERLQRTLTRSISARNVGEGFPVPEKMILGPKVMLIDRYSASDGDLFPYAFKKHNLGKVIGVRTWGGVVGIMGSRPFIDESSLYVPQFATYAADTSEYVVEGIGVEPDVWIDNDPYKEFMGEDAQLQKAIEIILDELKNFKDLPPVPNAPDKSK